METLWNDLRYGWRVMRRSPGFAAVAILTLAIGIGANAAIFSIVNGVLLRPLPFPDSSRIVTIWETDANRNVVRGTASPAEFLDWRDMNHSFAELSGWRSLLFTITGSGNAEQVHGSQVTGNFFRMLGVGPVIGRDFSSEDEKPGREQVAILTYALWRRHYGGDSSVIGKSILLDEKPYTIIGILPRSFSLYGVAPELDIWVPFAFNRAQLNRENHELVIFGRLRPGVSLPQAQAEMETIVSQLKKQYPGIDQENGVRVSGFHDELIKSLRPSMVILLAAVGFVLLIACANVANLMLARAATREREIAVRAALGAGRRRILRQLLTESALMALMGGALGIAVAYGGIHLLRGGLPPIGGRGQIPHVEWIGIDGTVLAFTLFVSLLTGIIFGLAPAIQISRSELFESLKEGSRGSTAGRRSHFIQSSLVVSEVALSLMLLVGAGVLIRSFFLIMSDSLGFDPSNVFSMQIFLSAPHYPKAAQVNNFYQRVIEGVGALPGVKSASAANFLPLTGWSGFCDFDISGRATPPSGEHFTGQYRVADWRYLQTMGISVKQGRDLVASDGVDTQSVALINEALARRYWPNQDPVGQQIRLKFPDTRQPWDPEPREGWLNIVGIVSDVRDWEWGEQKIGQIYLPYTQNASRIMHLVVRSEGDPTQLVSGVRSVVASVDPNQPVTDARSMDDYLAASVSRRRLSMLLLVLFAGVATVLAAVGIYGVMAYAVTQRSHEIGIRMALGAEPNDVLRMVVSDGMKLAGIGLLIGIAASYAAVHYLASQLYGVKAKDPITVICVSVGLALVAISACYFPARRATKVDPLEALRYE
jgi:putative ABC transport system permease protein